MISSRGAPSAKKVVASTDHFEAANGVTAAANGVTAATNGITAAASGVTAAAVMSIQYWKNLPLPEHWELEEASVFTKATKKALMALPVLYLSTWVVGTTSIYIE